MFKKDFYKLMFNQKGFSLVEILIGLTLIAIAGTFVAGKIFEQLQEGQITSTKIQIRNLGGLLQEYRRKCGTYPTTDQGLQALLEKPTGGRECKRYPNGGFIGGGNPKVPVDAWENDFVYESDGRTYTIISYGNDGFEGGEGADADISSADI